MNTTSFTIPNILSTVIVLLILITSGTGILTPDFYSAETLNWRSQSIGQDIINIGIVVPVLILCIILNVRRNKYAGMMMAGIHLYLVYTFAIYCFDVHFNKMFLVYCVVLGLSFYAIAYFMYYKVKSSTDLIWGNALAIRVTAFYFIFIASIFTLLWLSRILPSIVISQTPDELKETGLLTNPVHILDLSIILPAFLITGILILKKHNLGYLLAPVLLMFALLMDLTIA
ncbi:MAG TPA: hypothetical protein VL443_18455, partial [Cyclobacteriaceae bacterium]|nr:hypothetical protein [Cyclobacteriaceae bacterium]